MAFQDFPLEHTDELGPTTHRELIAKQTEDREDICQRLIPDKDAVLREAR